MRTNIDIDEELLAEARAALGTGTKKATVEAALRRVVQLHRQGEAIGALRGAVPWEGDLDALRRAWPMDALDEDGEPAASDQAA